MCFHYSLTKTALEVENRYQIPFDPVEGYFNEVYHLNGFSYAKMPVISNEAPDKISLYNWGLIPRWVKDDVQAKKSKSQTLNAKSETVFKLSSFCAPIKTNRCLVISDGFYEWRKVNGVKYPYRIGVKGGEIFSMAGIWESWKDSTGAVQKTFSILTCPANPFMAKIHNGKERMPVILPRELERDWLKKDLVKEEIESFFLPYPEEEMEAYTIAKRIGNSKENHNFPEILLPCEYAELPPL